MAGIRFDWDERNTLNRRKHGCPFEEARSVFLDEFALLIARPGRVALGRAILTLINLYLRDCAARRRKLAVLWQAPADESDAAD